MIVKIIRTVPNEKQTLGKFFIINDSVVEFDCHTLELPWKENKKNESCIPKGTYRMKRRFSNKHGQHWHIQNVFDRDMILIHTGNFHTQIQGCVLVGMGLADINKDGCLDVTESKVALERINDILINDEYELIIL